MVNHSKQALGGKLNSEGIEEGLIPDLLCGRPPSKPTEAFGRIQTVNYKCQIYAFYKKKHEIPHSNVKKFLLIINTLGKQVLYKNERINLIQNGHVLQMHKTKLRMKKLSNLIFPCEKNHVMILEIPQTDPTRNSPYHRGRT